MGVCYNGISDFQFPYYIDKTDLADVFCCLENTCSKTTCDSPQPYLVAKQLCELQNKRFCSQVELESGLCCNYDDCNHRIWTSDSSACNLDENIFYFIFWMGALAQTGRIFPQLKRFLRLFCTIGKRNPSFLSKYPKHRLCFIK
jgi:hypothetical protein